MPLTREPHKPDKPTVLPYSVEKPENRWEHGWRALLVTFVGEFLAQIVMVGTIVGVVWAIATLRGC